MIWFYCVIFVNKVTEDINMKFVYCCVLFTLRTFEAVTVCWNLLFSLNLLVSYFNLLYRKPSFFCEKLFNYWNRWRQSKLICAAYYSYFVFNALNISLYYWNGFSVHEQYWTMEDVILISFDIGETLFLYTYYWFDNIV